MVFEYGGINKDVGTWLVSLSTSISERYTSVTCINILVVLLYVCLAWISYCRSCLTKEWVTEDEWEYMRTLVSERMGDWRWMRIHEDVGVGKDGWLKMNETTWGRWCQKGWVIEDEWEYMRMLVSGRMGDWRWMRKHADVGVRKDGWLKMNENTWGCWCREGWVIDDEWEYMRMLVSQRMSDWRWMRIREDVGVAKDEWLKMNEDTWGRWCQNRVSHAGILKILCGDS